MTAVKLYMGISAKAPGGGGGFFSTYFRYDEQKNKPHPSGAFRKFLERENLTENQIRTKYFFNILVLLQLRKYIELKELYG